MDAKMIQLSMIFVMQVLLSNVECSISQNSLTISKSFKIMGGTLATSGQFPYQVAIVSADGHNYLCGGSLLTPWHVITAAHGLDGVVAAQLAVRVKSLDAISGGDLIEIAEIVKHPSYITGNPGNDIAIVKLKCPITPGPGIEFVKLPEANNDTGGGAGEYLFTISGYGAQKMDVPPVDTLLRFADITSVDRTTCQGFYGTTLVTDKIVCIGTASGGTDFCDGDVGSPLIFKGSNNMLVGVFSISNGNGCGLAGIPSMCTRVGSYTDWAQNVVGPGINIVAEDSRSIFKP